MKVAVTGATGFIGRHVLDELDRRAVETVAVVRSLPNNAQALINATMVRLDIQDAQADAFKIMGQPDVLIHLAWGGLPNYHSLHHYELELPTQYRFLKNLIESGLRTLVVAGTCFEYGMQSGPLSEDMETRPSNPYGFAKDVLRRQLEYLKVTHSFALVWSRLFYLYGEGQVESSLFPQLKKAVERGDKVFNMSAGEQLRDYLPVTKAARHVVDLALKVGDIGTINICAGRPISVRKLVEGWLSENGWSISLNLGHYPYPDYEPMAFWGDAQKFSSIIGKTT
jgi:dTDP-6-deoxy-L-talose 4-dehydrogenase (NAD+)